MAEDQELSLTIIDKSIDVFRNGSSILKTHKDMSARAMKLAENIIQKWEAADKIKDIEEKERVMSELDTETEKFLVKCRDRRKERIDERKAITQLMTTIATMFTTEETLLDVTKSDKLIEAQKRRNTYAKWKSDNDTRRKKEADDKANKLKEEADIRASVNSIIAKWLLDILAAKKTSITNSFNAITLADYEEKKNGLSAMGTSFPTKKLEQLVVPRPFFRYHLPAEVDNIKVGETSGYDYDKFYIQYSNEIEQLKRKLVDQLPSKKQELEEEENLRLKHIEDQKKRDAEIEKAKGEAKKKLEAENELKNEEAEKERLRLESERVLREEQEHQQLAEEDKKKKELAEQAIELAKQGTHAGVLFDQTIESASDKPAPSAKKSLVITIKHQAAWAQLFQFYYEKEGKILPLEEWESKTMKQIKSFCEKWATKNEELIESKFIEYNEEVKAINKKEKK